jgi:hypothetical protein
VEEKSFAEFSKFPRCFWGLAYLVGRVFSHFSSLRGIARVVFSRFQFRFWESGKGTDWAGFMGFEIGLPDLLFGELFVGMAGL